MTYHAHHQQTRSAEPRNSPWWTIFIRGYEARAVRNPSHAQLQRMTAEGWQEIAELRTRPAALDYAERFYEAVPGFRLCRSCVCAGVAHPPPGDLVVGRLYRESLGRVSIFKGYLCYQCCGELQRGWSHVGKPRERGGELRYELRDTVGLTS